MHIRIANDNGPMHAAIRKAGDRPQRRSSAKRSASRRAVAWRKRIDPMMVIPLCCTIALAVNAMLA